MESIGVLEGRDGTERLEILLDRGRGSGGQLHFRLLCWGEGIGWYPQKTVELDAGQIEGLQSLLHYAKLLVKKDRSKESKSPAPLLPFSLKQSSTKTQREPNPSFQKAG